MAPSRAERVRLAGQVSARGGEPTGFLRLSTNGDEWLTELDETGEFLLDSLKPGPYRLEVVLPDSAIEVPDSTGFTRPRQHNKAKTEENTITRA